MLSSFLFEKQQQKFVYLYENILIPGILYEHSQLHTFQWQTEFCPTHQTTIETML